MLPITSILYFNPRSDERSDSERVQLPYETDYFNPRSDERSDTLSILQPAPVMISIHAPTNGATPFFNSFLKFHVFQSTLRRTERRYSTCIIFTHNKFQSTLRRTERLHCQYSSPHRLSFQSTLRRTERLPLSIVHKSTCRFQSTLRRTERLQFCTKK